MDPTPNQDTVIERTDWRQLIADRLGICLSALCVVHCLLTPVVLVFLPGLSLFQSHEFVHGALLILLPLIALTAFIPGFRRHRDARVFAWSLPGFFFLVLAVCFFSYQPWLETGLSILGSALLIRAHLINRQLCACCQVQHRPLRRFQLGPRPWSFRSIRKGAPKRGKLLSPPRPPRVL